MRAPAAGQHWRYRVSDGLTGALVGIVDETVSEVGASVVIDRTTEPHAPPEGRGHWSRAVLGLLESRPSSPETLPKEVQQPWGMIALDPHWDVPQIYRQPIPLWPEELRPGWHRVINTEYAVGTGSEALSWQLAMRAERWEELTVPAGTFTALRYENLIDFTHADWSRVHCVRQETLWLAPEVGRWVRRVSSGSYYVDDTIDSSSYSEDARSWDLLDWS